MSELKKDGVASLRKAGNNRFKDAKLLLDKGDAKHLVASCYLAGYTIECWIKVAILKIMNKQYIEEVYITKENNRKEYFLKIHNLKYLFQEYFKYAKTGQVWYEKHKNSKGVLNDWSEIWRYENNIPEVDKEYTKEFMNQVEEFMKIFGNEVY